MKFCDLTGQTFHRWNVVAYLGGSMWHTLCDCGNMGRVHSGDLKSGQSKSCGCYSKEVTARSNLTHGRTYSSEYKAWACMVQRCTNPNNKNWKEYGGRGITVVPRWLKFADFFEDMGPKPTPKHTLERCDNSSGYCKDNCRWATRSEQAKNRRTTHFVTFQGKTKCVWDWADELGINRKALRARFGYGWSAERALTEPVRKVPPRSKTLRAA